MSDIEVEGFDSASYTKKQAIITGNTAVYRQPF